MILKRRTVAILLISIFLNLFPLSRVSANEGSVPEETHASELVTEQQISQINIFLSSGMADTNISPTDLHEFLRSQNAHLTLDAGGFSGSDDTSNLSSILESGYDAVNVGIREFRKGDAFLDTLTERGGDILVSSSITGTDGYPFMKYKTTAMNLPGGNTLMTGVAGLIYGSDGYAAGDYSVISFEEALSVAVDEMEKECDLIIILISGETDEDLFEILDNYDSIDLVALESTGVSDNLQDDFLIVSPMSHDALKKITYSITEDTSGISGIQGIYSDVQSHEIGGESYHKEHTVPQFREYLFNDEVLFSAMEDSSGIDLFHSAQLSHYYTAFPEETLPVISLVNLFSTKDRIHAGTVTTDDIMNQFPGQDRTIAIRITGEVLKRIMEESAAVYSSTSELDRIRLKSQKGFNRMDFFDSISFNISTENAHGERISELYLIEEDRKISEDEELILLLPESRFESLKKYGILETYLEPFWKCSSNTAGMLINYLDSYDGESLSFSTNGNWTIRMNGMKGLKEITRENGIFLERDIPHNPEAHSPVVQFLLQSVISSLKPDAVFMERGLIRTGIPSGDFNAETLESLFSSPLVLRELIVTGEELIGIMDRDVLNGNVQQEGLTVNYMMNGGKMECLDILDYSGNPIVSQSEYRIILCEPGDVSEAKGTEKLLQDIFADWIIQEGQIDFNAQENVIQVMGARYSGQGRSSNITYTTKAKKDTADISTTSTKTVQKIEYTEDKESKDQDVKKKTATAGKGKKLPDTGSRLSRNLIYLGIILILAALKIFFPEKVDSLLKKLAASIKK